MRRMRTSRRAAGRTFARWVLCWLAIACVWPPLCLTAQQPSQPSPSGNTPAAENPVAIRSVGNLDKPWRFHTGDDPLWADPSFDDSSWQNVSLSQSLGEQGIDSYTGYAWYRLKLQPQQVAQFSVTGQPLSLLLTSNSVGQLAAYVNGVEAGHTKGMTESPSEYRSSPIVVQTSPAASGSTVIAVRTWAGPTVTISQGILSKVEVGSAGDLAEHQSMAISRQWNARVISSLVLTFLFVCVAVLGAFLYMVQRHHLEYFWLTLMCLSVAAGGAADSAFEMGILPLGVYHGIAVCTGHIFMAITLQFVLHFTGTHSRRLVRGVQIAVLLIPLIYFAHLLHIYQFVAVAAEVIFCLLVTVLLFRAWRRGRTEAGVVLVPFFLAATADSADTVLDYATSMHWLRDSFLSHRFHLGPVELSTGGIAYSIFLGSLIAVILYRFVRISQDEQRSAAEISAARSVQALLIPTQLPSNRNFMLESAYLPVNGVGGDFFQVLPLKDDSLLIVVGDVSGKGLQAAMNSSTLVGALRNELSHDPATVLEHLNRVLLGAGYGETRHGSNDAGPSFATCLCVRAHPDGRFVIANAGHLGPYHDGRELEIPPGLPLGVIPNVEYEQVTYRLNQGDRLVFLSDGVVEATNAEGELFGFERTQQVSNEPARYIAQTAKHFGQTDDITVLSIYLSSKTAQPSKEELAYSR